MRELVEEIVEEIDPEIKKRKLYFRVTFSPEAAATNVYIDREAIKAALYNVIDNSVKYTQQGGIETRGEIMIHPIERSKILRIQIRDTGIGISKDELPKLFHAYFQRGAEAEKLHTTGRGIGLVLSKNIIKANHGNIEVDSPGPGKGSVFTIEFPVS